MARQYPRKNTITLLRAHRRLLARIPEARLRIVGDGPAMPLLRRTAKELGLKDRVTFMGALSTHAEVRRQYSSAHAFCMPSLQEGFGIVYLEAMAAGLPVVTSHRGAPTQVLGDAGLLVDPLDAEEMARTLARLLQDPGLRRRLTEKGRRRVRRFDHRRVARRYERTLLERFPRLSRTQP